jgi:hypothetical protein
LTAQHQRVATVAEHVEETAELAAFLLASGSVAQLLAARQSLLPGLRWLKQLTCVTAPTVPSTLKFVLSAADAALATAICRAGAVRTGDGADPIKCELLRRQPPAAGGGVPPATALRSLARRMLTWKPRSRLQGSATTEPGPRVVMA